MMASTTDPTDDNLYEEIAALAAAETAGEALLQLYRFRKRRDKKISLNYLCRRAGIPSSGYLADVMAQRRQLSRKYQEKLIEVLGLSDAGKRYLRLLFRQGDKRDGLAERGEKNAAFRASVELARKNLLVRSRSIAPETNQIFFAFELFCSFGLFGNTPTFEDLLQQFGEEKRQAVEEGLRTLEKMQLVSRDSDGRLRLLADQVLFGNGENFSHLEFIRDAMSQASDSLEMWFNRPAESHFVSTLISVKQEAYLSKMVDIKNQLLSMQSELESGDADRLIRFNVQIYPARE